MIWDSIREIVPGRASTKGASAPRRTARLVKLVAIVAVGALLLSQCGGDDEEAIDGDEQSTVTTAGAAESPPTTVLAVPPAPDPLPAAEPAPPAPSATPQAAASPPPAALSGPPPAAVGVMPDMAISVDGYAHALFVQEFFSGPVESYSATSSDGNVATAGVRTPDMLIVAPVSNGSASITVTASGPGGAATHTFIARVGAGPQQVARPPAPPPAPPVAAPAPPPPAPEESDELLPIDDDLPPLPPDTDAVPTESLPPAEATAAPTLSGTVPAQTVGIGQTITLDVRSYFEGFVQGWAVETSNPANVAATMTVGGRVELRGVAAGTATITVTARNSLGEVAQAITATASASAGTGTETTTPTTAAPARTGSTGILVLVGNDPSVTVNVGQSTTLDISRSFSAAAIAFEVRNVPSGVEVTVSGSVATISGVSRGTYTVTLVARATNSASQRPATITVN